MRKKKAEKDEVSFLLCKTWLSTLRNGTIDYTSYIYYLHQEMRTGKISFEEIGTTEEEIEELKKKGSVLLAKRLIEHIQLSKEKEFVYLLKEEMEKGYFSCNDIGITEEDLANIIKDGS